ncbi:MAG: FCD domain-containing protein [Chloroflexi bacterium]|nr:FCD domain-containing protein [Chloroflexota bacterium]
MPEHEAICEAIQARDARRARAAMAGHLRTMRERAPFELPETASQRFPVVDQH